MNSSTGNPILAIGRETDIALKGATFCPQSSSPSSSAVEGAPCSVPLRPSLQEKRTGVPKRIGGGYVQGECTLSRNLLIRSQRHRMQDDADYPSPGTGILW